MFEVPKTSFDFLPDSSFVRVKHLIALGIVPFSEATVWRKVKAGEFPAPTKISPNVTVWRVGAIRSWQAASVSQETVEGGI